MPYLVGGMMTKSYEEERKEIIQLTHGVWRFYCQGECAREINVCAVSPEARNVAVERRGFRPSGESFICEECLLALQVENIRGR